MHELKIRQWDRLIGEKFLDWFEIWTGLLSMMPSASRLDLVEDHAKSSVAGPNADSYDNGTSHSSTELHMQ